MRIATLIVLLAACGNPPVKPPNTPGSGTGSGTVTTGPGSPGKPTPGIVLKDVGCPTFTCVYHAGVNQYFTCLSGGAGTCFHFGGACMPPAAAGGNAAESCMYDSASRTYKLCTKGAEGLCQTWGGACTPVSKCMFEPASGLHKQCDDASGGTCKRYGALCAP